MPAGQLEVVVFVLAAGAALRFGRTAWRRFASQVLDPAGRSWIDRTERAAGSYAHLSRGLVRPPRSVAAGTRVGEASLALEAPQAQRAVA